MPCHFVPPLKEVQEQDVHFLNCVWPMNTQERNTSISAMVPHGGAKRARKPKQAWLVARHCGAVWRGEVQPGPLGDGSSLTPLTTAKMRQNAARAGQASMDLSCIMETSLLGPRSLFVSNRDRQTVVFNFQTQVKWNKTGQTTKRVPQVSRARLLFCRGFAALKWLVSFWPPSRLTLPTGLLLAAPRPEAGHRGGGRLGLAGAQRPAAGVPRISDLSFKPVSRSAIRPAGQQAVWIPSEAGRWGAEAPGAHVLAPGGAGGSLAGQGRVRLCTMYPLRTVHSPKILKLQMSPSAAEGRLGLFAAMQKQRAL